MRKIFVTGIGTNIGKTIASAILTEALQADYWKPIQTGAETDSDTFVVKSLLSNAVSKCHAPFYEFKAPLSPHIAAKHENKSIDLSAIRMPPSVNSTLIIEGAGGIMVPLNKNTLMIDLIEQFANEVIIVSQHYLGSINHTLMTYEMLRKRNVQITGIIFNGEDNFDAENYILSYTQLPQLLTVKTEKNITPIIVKHYANKLLENIKIQ